MELKDEHVSSYGEHGVFWFVAVRCSVLQCVAVCSSAVQRMELKNEHVSNYAEHGVLHCLAMCCSALQCVEVCCSVQLCFAT